MQFEPIAYIRSDFPAKFGIPRQSGLVPELRSRIVFIPQFRNPDAIRGIEGFSHLWLVWEFSAAIRDHWKPMVRPPRLGGEERVGVFASRSPFRPNPIGLSSVQLIATEQDPHLGPVLVVAGADLMDATAIFDIKPYVEADVHPEARMGFTARNRDYRLTVEIPAELARRVPKRLLPALTGVLAEDPRPAYHDDPDRIYGMDFAGLAVKFRVDRKILTVCQIEPLG